MNRWNIPATVAPIPTAATMNPSWLMVEKASTFLMSDCPSAMVAANMAVIAPQGEAWHGERAHKMRRNARAEGEPSRDHGRGVEG